MKKFSRRKVLKSILGISLYSIIPLKLEAFSFFHERNFSIFGTNKTNVMSFKLPELNYEYNALEPHFDARTMEIHHSKHHAGYTNNLNNLISGTEFEGKPIEEILKSSNLPTGVRNNGGGFYNHSLFWEILSPNKTNPSERLLNMINDSFGSFEKMKEDFSKAAATRFGSGWAWLGVKPDGQLCVCSTPNQDNPLMDVPKACSCKCTPILGLDVWEHAYYLNYQNRRPDYVGAFWNVVNWNKVAEKFSKAKQAVAA